MALPLVQPKRPIESIDLRHIAPLRNFRKISAGKATIGQEQTEAVHGRLAEAWRRYGEERLVNWLVRVWMAVAPYVRATRSPLIKAPAYRVLFFLVVAGVLLICALPEAAFVLPAFDAVGLDIVTILVALELRHYILVLMRLVEPLLSRCVAFMIAPTKPEMLPYACMWVLIAFRIVMGSMKVPPQAQG